MKGLEESLSQTVFLIGAVLAAILLIYMASQYLSVFNGDEKSNFIGDKGMVLSQIKDLSLNCWEKNHGRKDAAVCSQTFLNKSIDLSASEIANSLAGSKIPPSSVNAESISGPANVVITYKDNSIYIESR